MILSSAGLATLFERLTAAGHRIVAPTRDGDRVDFAEVTSPQAVAFDAVQTVRSAKAVLFPPVEPMLRYRTAGHDVQDEAIAPDARPTMLFGARPCDARSIATLKAVFTWDSPDPYVEPRLAATTIVTIACTKADAYCFCTSVGGGPADPQGSDILLTPIADDRWAADVRTDKGRALVAAAPGAFEPAGGHGAAAARPIADVPARFGLAALQQRLPGLFEQDALWIEQSLRCLGCGACAFVCPTCTCFDIQDERGRDGGVRLRCWDSCGFGQFTLHASGHNPRTRQSERWRQRVLHKFAYQPERLGVLGCVGCGRCSRSCPVDMNLAEHVQMLAEATA